LPVRLRNVSPFFDCFRCLLCT